MQMLIVLRVNMNMCPFLQTLHIHRVRVVVNMAVEITQSVYMVVLMVSVHMLSGGMAVPVYIAVFVNMLVHRIFDYIFFFSHKGLRML